MPLVTSLAAFVDICDEEFPEYKKYLDGSAQREEEEAKKAKEEAGLWAKASVDMTDISRRGMASLNKLRIS